MNPILRLTACLLAVLVVSALASLAWDGADRAAAPAPSNAVVVGTSSH